MENMGLTGTDKITGFTGLMTGFCAYLTGCNQVLLSPKVDKTGKPQDAHWFDEQRITWAKTKRISLDNGKTPGFDKEAPKY